jgi:hypothetical protein
MMGGYHANLARTEATAKIAGILALQKKEGAIAVVLPADLIFLTERLGAKIAAFEQQAGKDTGKELLISGKRDQPLALLLADHGWKTTRRLRI